MTDVTGSTTVSGVLSSVAGHAAGRLMIEWVYPEDLPARTEFTGARRILGRSSKCDVVLEHASVSRQHLEIGRQGPIFTFKDLGATNGTFLNGQRLRHSALAAGDVLRVGDCVGVVWRSPSLDQSLDFSDVGSGLFCSGAVAHVLAPARAAARSALPVLLLGETGTGKEVAARAIHGWSGRAGPFCAINCAALPDNLAEAELFGYRRGAFTGSVHSSSGLFRAAQGGTLLLDEVGDLAPRVQGKLLRALDQREVIPLGESCPVPIDVRVIAAGQLSLLPAAQSGAFREDLLARIAGLTIELPPLRARRHEVIPLLLEFLGQQPSAGVPTLTPHLAETLCIHDWPRNVRELKLLAEYLLAIHAREPRLGVQHLPRTFPRPPDQTQCATSGATFETRNEQDLHRLTHALARFGGNVKAATSSLGMSRARAYRLLERREGTDAVLTSAAAASFDRAGAAPRELERPGDS